MGELELTIKNKAGKTASLKVTVREPVNKLVGSNSVTNYVEGEQGEKDVDARFFISAKDPNGGKTEVSVSEGKDGLSASVLPSERLYPNHGQCGHGRQTWCAGIHSQIREFHEQAERNRQSPGREVTQFISPVLKLHLGTHLLRQLYCRTMSDCATSQQYRPEHDPPQHDLLRVTLDGEVHAVLDDGMVKAPMSVANIHDAGHSSGGNAIPAGVTPAAHRHLVTRPESPHLHWHP